MGGPLLRLTDPGSSRLVCRYWSRLTSPRGQSLDRRPSCAVANRKSNGLTDKDVTRHGGQDSSCQEGGRPSRKALAPSSRSLPMKKVRLRNCAASSA